LLPLQAGDTEPVIDRRQLLHQIYREASYLQRLNYAVPPVPALNPDKKQWVNQSLKSAKLL
jgi:hypothetical protein